MSCKGCGATDITEDGYQTICQQCGNVEESLYLVSDSTPMMSTFMKHENPITSIAYRNFKQLYHCCTRTLNTSYKIVEEGMLMLPQMWNFVRHKRHKTKKLYIIAMLYLLYRQHHLPVTLSQFLKHAHAPLEKLSTIVQLVMKQFNLPMFKCMNIADITSNSISELVKLVFKNSTKEMESDTLQISQRLVNVIYKKEWGETSSKNYISLVAIVSTLLAAQYVVSNMTHRKTKDGRKACFRFMTMNYQKMADHMCVHVMAVKKSLKLIQRKLFQLVQELPWTAACIKKSINVARMLVDLINYIDIDLRDEDDDEATLIPSRIKLILIQAIQTYISMHLETMKHERPLIDIEEFKGILNAKLLLENGESKENISVYSKDEVKIQGCVIKYHHLEMFKDLLLSGCSVDELLNQHHVALVEKYVDMSDVKDEDDMEDFTEQEMAMYFKNPALFAVEESKIELPMINDEFENKVKHSKIENVPDNIMEHTKIEDEYADKIQPPKIEDGFENEIQDKRIKNEFEN